jgi:CRP-like cAMP-binding protein
MELKEILNENVLFSLLDVETKVTVEKMAIVRSYNKDHWITHYGDMWPYLFVVGEGVVTALKESQEGRSLIVAQFIPGDVFWGLSFFLDNTPTPASLVSTETSRIFIWSREQLLPVLLSNGKMTWALVTLMVQRMLLASDMVEGLAFQPVVGRLAQFLLDRFGGEAGDTVSRDLTLEEMAAHIGTTREMVCRLLYKLSDQGIIEITRTEFKFKNRNKLKLFV